MGGHSSALVNTVICSKSNSRSMSAWINITEIAKCLPLKMEWWETRHPPGRSKITQLSFVLQFLPVSLKKEKKKKGKIWSMEKKMRARKQISVAPLWGKLDKGNDCRLGQFLWSFFTPCISPSSGKSSAEMCILRNTNKIEVKNDALAL